MLSVTSPWKFTFMIDTKNVLKVIMKLSDWKSPSILSNFVIIISWNKNHWCSCLISSFRSCISVVGSVEVVFFQIKLLYPLFCMRWVLEKFQFSKTGNLDNIERQRDKINTQYCAEIQRERINIVPDVSSKRQQVDIIIPKVSSNISQVEGISISKGFNRYM